MKPEEIRAKVEELREKKVSVTLLNNMSFEDATLVGYSNGFVFFVLKSGTPMSTPDYCIKSLNAMPEGTKLRIQDFEGRMVDSPVGEGFEDEIIHLGAKIAGIAPDEVSCVFLNVEGFAGEISVIVNYDVYRVLAESEENVDFGEDDHPYNIGSLAKYYPNLYWTILQLSKQYTIPAMQYERDGNILYISGDKKK